MATFFVWGCILFGIRYTKRYMKVLVLLKHIFIPHDKNDYKPHIFRELSVAIILFGSIFLLGTSFGATFFMRKTVLGVQISSGVLIDLTNENRLAYNQPALVRNTILDQAAELKGKDMAQKEYFSHDSPEGVTPWYWFRKVGYNFLYAGENLAINFTEAGDVERAWMQSPLHKANIMNVQFREIGLAVVEGMYEGYPTMYVVQMFGTPAYGKTLSNTQGEKSLVQVKENSNVLATSSRTGNVKGEQISEKVVETKNTNNKNESVSTILALNTATTSLSSSSTPTDPLERIVVTPEIMIVKDTSVASEGTIANNQEISAYSTWYQKVLFNAAHYVDTIYKIIVMIIGLALCAMIFIEIRRQHIIHIIYGVSLLLLLIAFMYMNTLFL